MMVVKAINLELLQEQFAAAGIALPRGLGLDGANLHTYDANGSPSELPTGAAPVVAAHDATGLTAAQQQAATDRADLAAFPTSQQVQAALAALDADLTTLGGSVTVAALTPILRRTVQNQRALVRALAVLVRRAQG